MEVRGGKNGKEFRRFFPFQFLADCSPESEMLGELSRHFSEKTSEYWKAYMEFLLYPGQLLHNLLTVSFEKYNVTVSAYFDSCDVWSCVTSHKKTLPAAQITHTRNIISSHINFSVVHNGHIYFWEFTAVTLLPPTPLITLLLNCHEMVYGKSLTQHFG